MGALRQSEGLNELGGWMGDEKTLLKEGLPVRNHVQAGLRPLGGHVSGHVQIPEEVLSGDRAC